MLGFIGIGNMGSAILKGALKQHYLKPEEVCVYDIDADKAKTFAMESKVLLCATIEELIDRCEMVMIAIKPNGIDETILAQRDRLKHKALLSIALGYDFERYNTLLDETTRHLFIMPNTPCLVGEGMSLLEASHSLTDEELEFAKGLFESIGEVEILPSHLMGVGGAMSGCSPAYLYMFIEAMADGGVKHGMPRDLAYKLASQTVVGAGKMQLTTELHPGILKDQVCSPGGSTILGVNALEDGNFRSTIISAISESLKK